MPSWHVKATASVTVACTTSPVPIPQAHRKPERALPLVLTARRTRTVSGPGDMAATQLRAKPLANEDHSSMIRLPGLCPSKKRAGRCPALTGHRDAGSGAGLDAHLIPLAAQLAGGAAGVRLAVVAAVVAPRCVAVAAV